MEAIRIIKEMRVATNGKYPRFAIFENVTGAFSSNRGEDFRIVLEEIIRISFDSISVTRFDTGSWKPAGRIIHAYGISYLFLPFNLFATYYFQSMMKADVSMIASVARGVVVSGVLIMCLPVVAGADSIWYAMLVTEMLVAAYSAYHMVKCTRQLHADLDPTVTI